MYQCIIFKFKYGVLFCCCSGARTTVKGSILDVFIILICKCFRRNFRSCIEEATNISERKSEYDLKKKCRFFFLCARISVDRGITAFKCIYLCETIACQNEENGLRALFEIYTLHSLRSCSQAHTHTALAANLIVVFSILFRFIFI